jgi:hypothetical protein
MSYAEAMAAIRKSSVIPPTHMTYKLVSVCSFLRFNMI